MYHPTTRVLTVLELLQSHQRMSGPELSRRLEVNTRTVRRYITMLQELGIPIEAERGRHGAYRLRPGFKLPPLMFTEDEALALVLGLLAVQRLNFSATGSSMQGALAKIERVMPETLRARVQAVQEALQIEGLEPGLAASSEVVMAISTAVYQQRAVWIRYGSWQGEETERVLHPYALVYRSGFWYTAGWCTLRNDVRLFRLDRIRQIRLLDETFSRPDTFDGVAFVNQSMAQMPGSWHVRVLLHTTLESAQEYVPPALGTLIEQLDGVLLEFYVQRLPWVAHFLSGLDVPMVVLEPAELRHELVQLSQRALAIASAP